MRKFGLVVMGLLIMGIPLTLAATQPVSAQFFALGAPGFADPEDIFEDNPARRLEAAEENRIFVSDISALGLQNRTFDPLNEAPRGAFGIRPLGQAFQPLTGFGVQPFNATARPFVGLGDFFENNPARRFDAAAPGRPFVPNVNALRTPAGMAGFLPLASTSDSAVRIQNVPPDPTFGEGPNTSSSVGGSNAANERVVELSRMAGLPEEFVGKDAGGVTGAGRPWNIERGQATLDADGTFSIEVQGLVLSDGANGAANPQADVGTNPLEEFGAAVSCSKPDGTFSVVKTDNFPASPTGDASHEQTIELPSPCVLPMVFVTTPDGRWIAAGGI